MNRIYSANPVVFTNKYGDKYTRFGGIVSTRDRRRNETILFSTSGTYKTEGEAMEAAMVGQYAKV